jgi:class 3 adenylate cyclase
VQSMCTSFYGMNQCLLAARAYMPAYIVASAQESAAALGLSGFKRRRGDPSASSDSASSTEEPTPPTFSPPKEASTNGPCEVGNDKPEFLECALPSEPPPPTHALPPKNPLSVSLTEIVREDVEDALGASRRSSSSVQRLSGTPRPSTVVTFVAPVEGVVEHNHRDAPKPTRSLFWQKVSAAGLSKRNVAVVFGNVAGFHAMCERHGPERSVKAVQLLTTFFQRRVEQHHGVLENLHGDRFMMTFNASSPTVTGVVQATAAALVSLLRELSMTITEFVAKGGVPIAAVRIGAASGTAVCGHIGSRSMQRHSTIGPVVHHAWRLMLHCKVLGMDTLVDERIASAIDPDTGVVTAAAGVLSFGREEMPMQLDRSSDDVRIFSAHLAYEGVRVEVIEPKPQ